MVSIFKCRTVLTNALCRLFYTFFSNSVYCITSFILASFFDCYSINFTTMAVQKGKAKPSAKKDDIKDSPKDEKNLQPDSANIQMPDVSDIPGQKHVHVPRLGELADTTISSDDEEGKGIFNDSEDLEDDANVTAEEKELLQETSESMASPDDLAVRRAQLDETYLEGEKLNENEDVSGKDLDVPGQEDDDANEEIGEEDEENNEYSLGGDSHDDIPNN